MQDCKVIILGTEYSIFFRDEKDDPKLKNCDGYMDGSVKKIVVGIFESDEMSIENLKDYSKKWFDMRSYMLSSMRVDYRNLLEEWIIK